MISLLNVHILKPDEGAGITAEHVRGLAESYGKDGHEAPVVIGHPKDNTPAFGWVKACRVNADNLYCDIDVTPDFKQLLDAQLFKKRSIAFYPSDPPQLRHLGFLGATPPRIKGLEEINLSDSIEPYMTQTTPIASEQPTAVPSTADFARPVALFALSESLPGVKASNLSSDPVVSGDSLSGLVELSDGKSYSYTIEKVGSEWKATTTLRNPELITLAEQVADLKSQLRGQDAQAKADTFYTARKLTEAIIPKAALVELIALSEGQAAKHLSTLLGNLPSLVSSNPVAATPETKIVGFEGFELSETSQYNQVLAKCAELKLNPNSPADFRTALNAL